MGGRQGGSLPPGLQHLELHFAATGSGRVEPLHFLIKFGGVGPKAPDSLQFAVVCCVFEDECLRKLELLISLANYNIALHSGGEDIFFPKVEEKRNIKKNLTRPKDKTKQTNKPEGTQRAHASGKA